MEQLDPITLEVVRGALVSTVLQMRATLVRTAYAPILYETRDFSCGLMTSQGELGAMSEDFSGHVFAMALGLNAARAKFGDDIHPGDVLASNDPYTGGTHLNDIAFYTPYFADGKVLLYIGVRAHHADVGGATPGSFSGQDTEIYQEGVRIVPVKLIERGVLNQALWDVLFANMRLAEERAGDALAMLDTARVAEAGIAELCDKYGPDTVNACINTQLDTAEQTMRQRISELPDGEYYYEHYMDNSGLAPEPLPIKVKMAVEGDAITFDFTGSEPQVYGPMNCGIPVTQGGAFVVVKSWLDPKTPVNGGTFRPLRFVIPEGSCLAAQLPAAVGGCWEIFRQLQSAVVGLFSQVMPDEPGGENLGTGMHRYLAGYDTLRDRPYILYDYPGGGAPASADTDGSTGTNPYDAGDMPMAQPAESIEQRQPLLVESLEVLTDREGAGYRRSGFTVGRKVRVLSETAQLSVMTDRATIPPYGAAGAPPGYPNTSTVIRDGKEIQPSSLPGKVKGFPMKQGDVLLMRATAGGGVGDPLDREVWLVMKDVIAGYITPRRAAEVYGVAIQDGHVDRAKTDALRGQKRKERHYFKVIEAATDEFDERGCRICLISSIVAVKIGVTDGDMVEYIGRNAAPLRAWAKIDDGADGDGVSMGPIGQSILGVSAPDQVLLRPMKINTADDPIDRL